MDIIELNRINSYLDIIEVAGNMFTVKYNNIEDVLYFVEKMGDGGYYEITDEEDKIAYIELF